MRKPITPATHGLIDYGFTAILTAGPVILNLDGAARMLPQVVGLLAGVLNGLTDQPYALKRLFPFQVHHAADTGTLPAILVTALATGAGRDPRARPFLLGMYGLIVANYLLTDWDADPDPRTLFG